MEYNLGNFPDQLKADIKESVRKAELLTSGEIRVFLEDTCKLDVLDRAAEVFELLELHKTEARNGVLFYLALKDHKFAILGDSGINSKVPKDFWDQIKEDMQVQFKKGELTTGLNLGIGKAGAQLAEWFPRKQGDINELSDDIVMGE